MESTKILPSIVHIILKEIVVKGSIKVSISCHNSQGLFFGELKKKLSL